MLKRKRLLKHELKCLIIINTLNNNHNYKTEELKGRISGDIQWRQSRGECNRNASVSYKLRCTNATPTELMPIPIMIDNDYNIKYTDIRAPDCIINTTSDSTYHYKYLLYHGGAHGDTESFDIISDFVLNTISVLPTEEINNLVYDSLMIDELILFAGSNLCNGIQINYKINDNVISSPPFTSPQDNPQTHTIKLRTNEKIKQIIIQAGALVDGITVITSFGTATHVGGTGGETHSYNIGDDEELIGFYGGVGGHLHNIGLILRPSKSNNVTHNLIANESTMAKEISLLSIINTNIIEHQVYYSLVPFTTGNYYHKLLSVLYFMLTMNEKLPLEACLQQYLLYSKNIQDNLSDVKYRKIKVSNKYFMKIRNCLGGIALTTVGTLCMTLPIVNDRIDNECFIHSKIQLIKEGGGNSVENTSKYIERFNALLNELVKCLSYV